MCARFRVGTTGCEQRTAHSLHLALHTPWKGHGGRNINDKDDELRIEIQTSYDTPGHPRPYKKDQNEIEDQSDIDE